MSIQPVKTHLPSVAQLVISIIGLVTSIGTAIALVFVLQFGKAIQQLDPQSNQSIYLLVWVAIILALISIPSLIYSIRRLARWPLPSYQTHSRLIASSITFIAIIPLVYLIYSNPNLLSNSFLKVMFSFIAVAIPLWWFVELGQNKLKHNSPQRFWGLVNFQIFAGLPIVIFLEAALFILAIVLGSVWLADKQQFAPILMTFQTQLMIDPGDMTTVINQVGQLFENPGVLAVLLFSFSIVVPLVEELIKPLALWFFIKQDWSEVEGFTAGLVCGAAFALVESVTAIISLPQENWTILLIARIGTGLLHTLTAGLTGWGLVSAWKSHKFTRLGLTYLISMSIHGAWNFFALLSGLGASLDLFANSSFSAFSNIAPWGLGVLFAAMLGLLFYMNYKIRSSAIVPPPIPPLVTENIG